MKKLMKVALSSEQIKKAVNTNLLTYNELINYNSLAKNRNLATIDWADHCPCGHIPSSGDAEVQHSPGVGLK